jgi:hypothetical protein
MFVKITTERESHARMTPRQIELARHALGLTKPGIKCSYRKHFCAGPGHADYDEWVKMVADGNAVQRKNIEHFGGDDLFHLTPAGAMAALRPGESLDHEDFPT